MRNDLILEETTLRDAVEAHGEVTPAALEAIYGQVARETAAASAV